MPRIPKGRVRIFNFDPVEQAKLWVSNGPEEAIKILNGYLRTAVLIGEEIVLDRNDLLDGIYFLSLGPEGIAEVLGVPTYDKLPILVMGFPINDMNWDIYAKDSQRVLPQEKILPNAYSEEVSLKLRPASINQQLHDTNRKEYWDASSALYATIGDPQKIDNNNSWMIGSDFKEVFPGAGFTHKKLAIDNEEELKKKIRESRASWANAIYKGKLEIQAFRSWNELSLNNTSNGGVENESKAIKQAIDKIASAHNRDNPLIKQLTSLPATTKRKEITGYLTGNKDIRCPHCKFHIQTLWSRAYAQTLAWKDQAVLITFPTPTAKIFNNDSEKIHKECLILNQPLKSTSAENGFSISEHKTPSETAIKIPGELIQQLRNIGPDSYRLLYNSSTPRPISYKNLNAHLRKEKTDLNHQEISRRIRDLKYNTNKLHPNFTSATKDLRGLFYLRFKKLSLHSYFFSLRFSVMIYL